MSADGERVAPDVVQPLMHFLASQGVDGFFVAGSTGQGPLLKEDEWQELVNAVLAWDGNTEQVLVHVSAPSTGATLNRLRFALDRGARSVVVSTPVAYRYEKRAVLGYFEDALKAARGVQVFLYRKSGDPWGAAEAAGLRQAFPNLAGVKDSATDMVEHLALIGIEGFEVYQGYEALVAASALAGGAGTVSGLATALPEPVVRVARLAGLRDEAVWEAQRRLTAVRRLVCGTNPYAAFKALLAAQGLRVGAPRKPFIPFTPEETASLLHVLKAYGIGIGAEDRRAAGR